MATFRRTKSINEKPPSANNGSSGETGAGRPLSASSRSNSWTGKLLPLPLTPANPPPLPPAQTPPSPCLSTASSIDTVTPPPPPPPPQPHRASISSFFKSGRSSRPSTANSARSFGTTTTTNSSVATSGIKLSPNPTVEMNIPNPSHDDLANQLILGAIDRTRGLTRTDSIGSTTSSSDPPHILHHSASSPSVQPVEKDASTTTPKEKGYRSSWFGFSTGGGKNRSRPTSEIITPIGVNPTNNATLSPNLNLSKATPTASPMTRPTSLPVGNAPSVTAALKTLSLTSPVPTITEGVPLTHSMTMDSVATTGEDDENGGGRRRRGRSFFRDRARSSSPFKAFRSSRSRGGKDKDGRERSTSPSVYALKCSQSDAESDGEGVGAAMAARRKKSKATRVRSSAFDTSTSEEVGGVEQQDDEEGDEDEESWSEDEVDEGDEEDDDDDGFDPETTQNTEANATTADIAPLSSDAASTSVLAYDDETIELPDPLGEGVNVVRPEEPMFARTLMANPHHHPTPALTPAAVAARTPKRKRTLKSAVGHHDPLPLDTSRPHFARDRCTVVIRHGDPDAYSGPREGSVGVGEEDGERRREPKKYLSFSDLSEESRWAVEWGIGTVLRDGDEMILVTVQETDSKLDPAEGANVDRLQKLRNQQERQALASLLVRQATALLQRTKLNVTITCQALHAKNARRLFLDIIDFIEPTMVIVGSRGLGKLKGILLGSTSHYLIQKSSVPVMVARRRLKRPTRKSHTAAQAVALRSEKRVSLAEARIEKSSTGGGKGGMGVDKEDLVKEHEAAEKEWPRAAGEEDSASGSESDEEEGEGSPGGADGEGEEGVGKKETAMAGGSGLQQDVD